MTDTTPGPQTASFKLHREITQLFTIDYKEKDDLYRSFQRKIDDFGIPNENVYFVDRNGDNVHIKDADTLFGIVKDNPRVRVDVRSDDDHSYSSSDSVEHLPGQANRETRSRTLTRKSHHHSRSKSRGHSRSKGRHHSRSKSRNHSRSKSRGRSRSKSRDHSLSKGRHHSRSKSRDHSRSKSRDHPRTRHHCHGSCGPWERLWEHPGFYHEFSNDSDSYIDQPPPFSSARSPCFPMDPGMGYGPFCGMGRGRGGFHRGGMRRGAFHG